MQRRTFLALATGGVAALAGCSRDDGESTTTDGGERTSAAATASSTPSRTRTATATPESEANVADGEPSFRAERGD